MDTEVATNPETAADAQPEPEVAEQPEQETTDEIPEQQPEDDSEDIEYEGKNYRLPREIKEALLRQADYTRKTQEVAEQRKALDTERASFAEQAKAQQEHLHDLARLVAMDDRLADYGKLNWQELWAQDPQQAGQLTSHFQTLQQARATLAGELDQKQRQRALQAQQEAAKRMEEAQTAIKRDIPEWSPELASKLRDFAMSKGGMKPEEVAGIVDPRHVKLLHLAYIGQQALDKQRQAVKRPVPDAKPVPTVRSRSAPATKDPDKMSTEEWMQWRRAQLAKR